MIDQNYSLKSNLKKQIEHHRQNIIIRKIVDSQIKLIHINKKQKAQRVRHVGRLMVRLLNETNYIFDQAPSYVWGITNIIYCDETMNSISQCILTSVTIFLKYDWLTKGLEHKSVISVLNRSCVS
jgi:hypothetical protein